MNLHETPTGFTLWNGVISGRRKRCEVWICVSFVYSILLSAKKWKRRRSELGRKLNTSMLRPFAVWIERWHFKPLSRSFSLLLAPSRSISKPLWPPEVPEECGGEGGGICWVGCGCIAQEGYSSKCITLLGVCGCLNIALRESTCDEDGSWEAWPRVEYLYYRFIIWVSI